MGKCITVAVAGFGLRARDYSRFSLKNPDRMRIVAVAEPDDVRREEARAAFGIEHDRCFRTAEEMLAQPRMAELLFVTTQDRQHVPMAEMGLARGYHILMEKPISPSLAECIRLRDLAHTYRRSVTVCHVMRYTSFFQTIKEAIESGAIGAVKAIQAIENVGYFHQAHSFVRGNWRRGEETSPMILAKSCHDLDLIAWLCGKRCLRVSSFGSLSFFNKEHAPQGAAMRCLDGCQAKAQCPYDAEKIYVTNDPTGIVGGTWRWPCSAITSHPTKETVYEALRTGPYGRCVFHCDNDVVDHQVVQMEFEDETLATLTMCAFTNSDGRQIKVMGTYGDIIGDIDTNRVIIQPFGKSAVTVDTAQIAGEADGHAGGDMRLIEYLVEAMAHAEGSPQLLTSIDQSVQSHVMAMAAEHSRTHGGACIDLENFIQSSIE